MLYRLKLEPEQARTLAEWIYEGGDSADAPILLDSDDAGNVLVGQGDARLTISAAGKIAERLH